MPKRTPIHTTTPRAASMVALLGGPTFEGIQFTRDESEALNRLYGFSKAVREKAVEDSRVLHAAQVTAATEANRTRKSWEKEIPVPGPFDEKGTRQFLAAGDGRNMFRHAQHDGRAADGPRPHPRHPRLRPGDVRRDGLRRVQSVRGFDQAGLEHHRRFPRDRLEVGFRLL